MKKAIVRIQETINRFDVNLDLDKFTYWHRINCNFLLNVFKNVENERKKDY